MSNFDLSSLAIQAVCPNNVLKYDDKNMPSVMVRIPKMTFAQLGVGSSDAIHPAFIIDGVEKDCIYISKYQNIVQNGRAYSLPGQDPGVNLGANTARGYCEAKGAGWHLMTAAEWSLLALWCKNNEFLPYGNNQYGKDSRESNYRAIPANKDASHYALRVLTGTGPLEWSHDKTPSGIWDLNGNVSEWVDGLRLVKGELQILANNNAANYQNSKLVDSAQWKAIKGSDGTLIDPDGSGTTTGSLKLDYVSSKWKWITGEITSQSDSSRNCTFVNVSADSGIGDAALRLLYALGMLPDDTTFDYEGDYFYANNGADERFLLRGGSYNLEAYAGVFLSSLFYDRGYVNSLIGFRSAFYE